MIALTSDVLHELNVSNMSLKKKSYTAAKIDKGLSVTQLLEMLSIFAINQEKWFFSPAWNNVLKIKINLTLTQLGNKMLSELLWDSLKCIILETLIGAYVISDLFRTPSVSPS